MYYYNTYSEIYFPCTIYIFSNKKAGEAGKFTYIIHNYLPDG